MYAAGSGVTIGIVSTCASLRAIGVHFELRRDVSFNEERLFDLCDIANDGAATAAVSGGGVESSGLCVPGLCTFARSM